MIIEYAMKCLILLTHGLEILKIFYLSLKLYTCLHGIIVEKINFVFSIAFVLVPHKVESRHCTNRCI